MKVHNVEQKSPEWFELRKKYPLTASEAQAIGNNGAGLESLVYKKLSEVYSSGIVESYTNDDMERGVELEPQARSLYELETGTTVTTVGFITNPKVSKSAGASPDGLVGEIGLLEIKSFEDVKHFKMIVNGLEVESKYLWQMQMQMLMTGRSWCDFLAYNPNFEKSLLVTRIYEDKEMQSKIREGLKKGEALIKEIRSKV